MLVLHHALYDAWTLEKFIDDLSYNYDHPNAEREGREPYLRFIQHMASMDHREAAKYWTHQLADTPILQFPEIPEAGYRPRARKSATLDGILDLNRTKEKSISAATLVAAAWAILLSSYCDMENICYGTVLSGRDEAFLEDIMGPTICTVPVRLAIKTTDMVADLLIRTQDTLLKMQLYQHFGLERISRLPSEGPRNACNFSSLLVVQQNMTQMIDKSVDERFFDFDDEQAQMFSDYPLVIISSINSTTGQLQLEAHYDDRCIHAIQIRRILCHLCHTMKQLANLDGSVGQVEVATPEDKAQVMAWNPPPQSQSTMLLHELFEETVSRQPQSTAIDSILTGFNDHEKWSYVQVNNRAAALATQISQNGPANRLVAVCLSKSALVVISMIAILKAGRAFVPLDTSAPTGRIGAILDNLGQNALIITEPGQVSRFPGSELLVLHTTSETITWRRMICMTIPLSFQGSLAGSQELVTEPSTTTKEVSSESTAFVLHTSGSTGNPKCIVVSHRSSTTSLTNIISSFKMSRVGFS